jgi:phosphatidate cytidylyltransferase
MGVTIAPYCQIHCTPESVLIGLAVVVTLVAHVGDILESAAKRLFKAKESGHLIPGHGGLLDRMDSLLLVGLFLKIIQYFKVL